MKSIPLSRGLVAFVDDCDFDFLMQWKWSAMSGHRTFYAHRRPRLDGRQSLVLMHRLILCPKIGMVTDHIDGNGLNNTRGNLREATPRQNMMNRRPQLGGSSSLKGVWLDPSKRNKKEWRSGIRIDGRMKYLGRFDTQEDAAKAYAAAASEHFGDFHRTTDGSAP